MKNLFASFIVIASISLSSCTKEVQSIIGETNEDFTATLISGDTRTSLDDNGNTVWSDADEVSIFKKSGYHQKYQVNEGGATSAVLSYANVSSEQGAALNLNYAVYPYSANHTIDAQGTLSLDLSYLAEQTYTEGTFENNKSVMVAKSDDNNLAFFNALSLLRVKLCSEVPGDYSIKSITVTSATQPINGTATLDMGVSKQPAIFNSTAAENKSTMLTCQKAVMLTEACNDTEGGHDFYILMPAATFPANDLTIEIEGVDVNGNDVVYSAQYPAELKLVRSGITTIHHEFVATDWQGNIEPTTTVATAQDLLAAIENAENISTIELAGDIDLQGIDWTPVGTEDAPFSANIDGKGFSIKNLTIADPTLAAFIAYTGENVTIKNLTFEDVNISSSNGHAAGVVGENNYDDLVIDNVKVSGTINAKSYAGGIIFLAGGVEIKNCVNEATINAGFAGGIASFAYYGTEIYDVENTGNITGSAGAGGIAFDFGGTMKNAVNKGVITSNGVAAAGGIACRQNAASKYEYCYNYGDVISIKDDPNASAAGILGLTPGSAATLNYCANYGNITAEQSYAAGIAYSLYGSVTANYCYNEGAINGADGAGAIAPKAQYGSTDKALYCLNAGTINSSNGTIYQASYTNTSCFYYNNGELLSVGNNAPTTNADALSILNGGADGTFFVESNGEIIVNN